jgi:hypothetical protein
MVTSRAATVDEYLAELPPERRAVVSAVRDVVRRHMPAGYRESMQFGMIGWGIPLERYADTYNGQPLGYVALAAQKNHYSLYFSCAYQDPADLAWLEEAWSRAGRRLDMGKSCVRFQRLEELPLDVVGEFVGRTPPDAFIASYEKARATSTRTRPARTPAKQAGAKTPAARKRPAARSRKSR